MIFVVSIVLMVIVQCEYGVNDRFIDINNLELVDLKLPSIKSEANLKISDAVSDSVAIKEEKLRFGDESGDYKNIESKGKRPRLVSYSYPTYPSSMRNKGIEGKVIIEIGLNEEGAVLYGKIVKSLHGVFDNAVIEWAKNIRYTPARDENNNPYRCRFWQPVRFTLDM